MIAILKKQFFKFLIPILSIIILLSVGLVFYHQNKDLIQLSRISKEIVDINCSLNSAIIDNKFDHDKAASIIKKNLDSFNKINNELKSMSFKKTDSEKLRKSLYDYTNININLYNSALQILNNKSITNFLNLYNNLIKNEKDILQTSAALYKSHLKLSFPKEANVFFINLNKYANTLYKLNREKDITDSQKLEFILYSNNLCSNFEKLKQDVQPALSKIREEKRNLSVLLEDINNKRSNFSIIKKKSYSISIPYGAENCYNALEDMLNSYEVYINSLENSVKSEIELSNNDNVSTDNNSNKSIFNFFKDSFSTDNTKTIADVADIYKDTIDKYNNFLLSFKSFETAITEYKNK